jgi:hypothetical protein
MGSYEPCGPLHGGGEGKALGVILRLEEELGKEKKI